VDEVRVEYGQGQLYLMPDPVCPAHGQMHQDFAMDQWTCAGWDGEGCDHVVTNEERWRDAKPLGTADPGSFRWKL
jgi:hypothetical protein